MYKSSYQNRYTRAPNSPPSSRTISYNSTIITTLTILSTLATIYLISLITKQLPSIDEADVQARISSEKWSSVRNARALQNSPGPGVLNLSTLSGTFQEPTIAIILNKPMEKFKLAPISMSQQINTLPSPSSSSNQWRGIPARANGLLFGHSRELQPIVGASELKEIKVAKPGASYESGENLKMFKQKLSTLSRAELLKLLKILQQRIDQSALMVRKRQIVENERTQELVGAQTVAKFNTTTALGASDGGGIGRETSTSTTTASPEARKRKIVARSGKMQRLMDYLDHLESIVPRIDMQNLERMSTMDGERSIVRVMRPEVMNKVLKTDNNWIGSNSSSAVDGKSLLPEAIIETQAVDWRRGAGELIESVAPEAGWPQQPVEEADWPSTAPPKQRKRKRKRITTTTTSTTTSTTTTSTTPAPEIQTTTVQPASLEEIWIEEEEDIVRPPRRKTKKYKKKTSPQPDTTTSTTTTTTTSSTTTTQAPTTTLAPIEDWPEEVWPEQPVSSTKAPKLWPSQPQPEQEERWPEEEWLNALRDDIQNRLHVVYV